MGKKYIGLSFKLKLLKTNSKVITIIYLNLLANGEDPNLTTSRRIV